MFSLFRSAVSAAAAAPAARLNEARSKMFNSRTLTALGGVGLALGATAAVASASDGVVDPPHYAWDHLPLLSSFDYKSVKRGYQVYRQVCSSCHSMNRLAFRNVVGVIHTEDEAKAIASEYEVKDGPNDEGDYFERPGKLSDKFPAPYANEQMARFANNGALPPDLSLIVKARPRHEDYVFALLTGYSEEPPAGVKIGEGQHYNPHFAGGAISMAPPLSDGQVEYEDGTVATVSQMAKDVSTFLAWASEPEHDERKLMGIKFIAAMSIVTVIAAYYKRFRWSMLKTRRQEFRIFK